MVFDFAVAVSDYALISSRFLQVMVAAPGHGGREIGPWSEIICHLIHLYFSTSDYMHSSTPYHPRGVPIFPTAKQNIRTK